MVNKNIIAAAVMMAAGLAANAQSRLTIGGYGEAVMSRNFYSQHFNRYRDPATYKDDKSHGRFDIPHVTINLGYDFGKGWTMGTEIEFEHGGTESAVEIDADESGEYEAEVEKGGEVALEQFWLNKAFWSGKFNVKAGEIIIPVGEINQYHLPDEFFSVYRTEGECPDYLFRCEFSSRRDAQLCIRYSDFFVEQCCIWERLAWVKN